MEENKDLPSTNDTTKASTEVSTQVSNEAVTHTVGEHIHAICHLNKAMLKQVRLWLSLMMKIRSLLLLQL